MPGRSFTARQSPSRLNSNYTDLLRNDEKRFATYRQKLLERGIFELPLNLKRNHIGFSHDEQHIEQSLEAAEDVLRELA